MSPAVHVKWGIYLECTPRIVTHMEIYELLAWVRDLRPSETRDLQRQPWEERPLLAIIRFDFHLNLPSNLPLNPLPHATRPQVLQGGKCLPAHSWSWSHTLGSFFKIEIHNQWNQRWVWGLSLTNCYFDSVVSISSPFSSLCSWNSWCTSGTCSLTCCD